MDHGSILHNSVSAVDYHFHPTIKASTPERDKVTVRLAADLLAGQRRETGKDVDCVFLHIDQCDSAGHSSTWDSDEYRRSVTQVDELVGQIVNAVNRRKNRANEQWLIMITTDHGGPANAKSHGDNSNPEIYTIPMIVWCDGIDQRTIPACSLYDVTPTVLSWMGIKQLPTELRGKSLLSGNEQTK